MKYKVGDVVRVKTRSELIESSEPSIYGALSWRLPNGGHIEFVASMHKYCNEVHPIIGVFEGDRVYNLEGCGTWCFCDEMLDAVDDGKGVVDLEFDDVELSSMLNEFKVL